MNLSQIKNRGLIVAGIVILLVFVAGFIGLKNFSGSSQKKEQAQKESVIDDTEIYPTVGAGVEVAINADKLGREITLSIRNIPNSTDSIDYELSYVAEGNLPKGVIGTIEVNGDTSVKRDGITLGTCSSGTCVYDKGVKEINAALKFNGSYGSQVFEQSFEI